MAPYTPLGINDTIHVRGKHLYKRDGTQFTIKGIAFPTPPGNYLRSSSGYDAKAWLAILKQLRLDLDLDFNTIRLYRINPVQVNYQEFFDGAATLGIYVIVPLTTANGVGVLDRTLPAPTCYNRNLFGYGASALVEYLKYPNVLAGIVGNEVMNDEDAWQAAPCVRGYARDLKLFMDRMVDENMTNRTLPLIYASQDSSVIGGAEMDKNRVMKLTADYLTCAENGKGTPVSDVANNEPESGLQHFEENRFGQSPLDIIGINVESWCSSTQNFLHNPDGTPGSYFALHEALKNTSVPIIFTEMGCPHSQFDRDDKQRRTPEGTRDWAQVPIVLNEMADSWNGFIAYAYDGPIDFDIMSGGPWNGIDTLSPTKDFYNLKKQLDKVSSKEVHSMMNETKDDDIFLPRSCAEVESDLLSCCDLRIFNDDLMQSYQKTFSVQNQQANVKPTPNFWHAFLVLSAFALYVTGQKICTLLSRRNSATGGRWDRNNGDIETKYGTISQ